jgi:hypothetical protein
MSDLLSNLRTEFRTAILLRNKGLALSLLKQLNSLDPGDEDSQSNLDELVKGVTRDVERVMQQFASPTGGSEDRAALIDALDEKVPYWKSFVEEIPGLAALTETVPSIEGLESQLKDLLKQGACDAAVKKWLGEGGPMNLEGSLTILLKHLEAAQSCEEAVQLQGWKKALEEIEGLDPKNLSDEIPEVKKWVAASSWRLKARGLIAQASALKGKAAKLEVEALAAQIAVMQEELRARPALSGGTSIDRKLAEASIVLAQQAGAPATHGWLFPLAFVGVIAAFAVALAMRDTDQLPESGTKGPPRGPETPESPPTGAVTVTNPAPVKPWRPAADKAAFDPKPSDDDVSIPMPNGWQMVFRKIYLPEPTVKPGLFQFEARGSSGTVWAPFSDKGGRYYLIAKHETSRGQYAQFMGLEADVAVSLPVTDVTVEDMEKFCELMSTWLGRQPGFSLKSVSGRPGRVRLPTLIEWQFAACGGVQTYGTPLFEERWPWGGPVTPREWHSGPASSSGELRPVGILEAHPLGLFDVLGNARELAADNGQYWMVGCDYVTADSEFSAFSNEVVPRLKPEFNRPFQQPEVGFRLLLSADANAFEKGSSGD